MQSVCCYFFNQNGLFSSTFLCSRISLAFAELVSTSRCWTYWTKTANIFEDYQWMQWQPKYRKHRQTDENKTIPLFYRSGSVRSSISSSTVSIKNYPDLANILLLTKKFVKSGFYLFSSIIYFVMCLFSFTYLVPQLYTLVLEVFVVVGELDNRHKRIHRHNCNHIGNCPILSKRPKKLRLKRLISCLGRWRLMPYLFATRGSKVTQKPD